MPRAKHKYHYIYKTTCNVNGKYYVGMHSTSNLEDGYLGSGKILMRSLKKYGKENHIREILEMLDDRSSLKERERELVNEEILQDPMNMNLKIGGEGGLGFISEEQQRNRSIAAGKASAKKLKEDKEYRERFMSRVTQQMKERHKSGNFNYATFTGKKHSEETKKKMSEADRTGNKNSQFGTMWITNDSQSKKIKKSDSIPEGWRKGRVL